MGQYAKDTSVSCEKSRYEIEKTLQRYGADNFMYGTTGYAAIVGFSMFGRQIKFIVTLPDRSKREFTHTSSKGIKRSEEAAYATWEQACRQRWRALNLVIKAKLEAVECGISVFEDEFMANIVLPGGQTVGDFMRPQIEQAYLSGHIPNMLPMLEG